LRPLVHSWIILILLPFFVNHRVVFFVSRWDLNHIWLVIRELNFWSSPFFLWLRLMWVISQIIKVIYDLVAFSLNVQLVIDFIRVLHTTSLIELLKLLNHSLLDNNLTFFVDSGLVWVTVDLFNHLLLHSNLSSFFNFLAILHECIFFSLILIVGLIHLILLWLNYLASRWSNILWKVDSTTSVIESIIIDKIHVIFYAISLNTARLFKLAIILIVILMLLSLKVWIHLMP
jgi:hypothetical protein